MKFLDIDGDTAIAISEIIEVYTYKQLGVDRYTIKIVIKGGKEFTYSSDLNADRTQTVFDSLLGYLNG